MLTDLAALAGSLETLRRQAAGLAGKKLIPGNVIELPASEKGKTGLDKLNAQPRDRPGRPGDRPNDPGDRRRPGGEKRQP